MIPHLSNVPSYSGTAISELTYSLYTISQAPTTIILDSAQSLTQSATQSISQSVSQLANYIVSQSVRQSDTLVKWSVRHAVNQSVGQSVCQPLSQSVGQSWSNGFSGLSLDGFSHRWSPASHHRLPMSKTSRLVMSGKIWNLWNRAIHTYIYIYIYTYIILLVIYLCVHTGIILQTKVFWG